MTAVAPETRVAEWLRAGGPRLSIGMLTADLGRLEEELAVIERAGAELVHIDVMDGVFVPQLTFGAPIVRAILTSMVRDVHLMVADPLAAIEPMLAVGAEMITFHVEATVQPLRVLQAMRGGVDRPTPPVRGIALTPSTPIESIEPLLEETDYVLILAVNPGWGGQSFLASTGARVERARRLIEGSRRAVVLGIDGGVTRDNVDAVLRMDADIVVTGSAVFDGTDASGNARHMLERAARARRGSASG